MMTLNYEKRGLRILYPPTLNRTLMDQVRDAREFDDPYSALLKRPIHPCNEELRVATIPSGGAIGAATGAAGAAIIGGSVGGGALLGGAAGAAAGALTDEEDVDLGRPWWR